LCRRNIDIRKQPENDRLRKDIYFGKRLPEVRQQIILHKLHNYKFFDFMNKYKNFLFDLAEFHCQFPVAVRDPRLKCQLIPR